MFDYNYNHMLIVYGSHVRIWAPGMKYAMMIVLLLRFWGRHRLSLRYAAARDRTLHLSYVWLHTAALRQCAAAQFLRSAAHRLCLRLCCRTLILPRSIVPRTCMPPLAHGAARAAKWSQVLRAAALLGAAHLYAAAHLWCRACGQMVSSSTCCRAPWCRAPVCRRSPMVPRVRPNGLKFYVLPRSLVPRPCMPPLTYGAARAAKWSQVLCVAASHGAAQFYMLPR